MTRAILQEKDHSTNEGILYMANEMSNTIWKLAFNDGRSKKVSEVNIHARDYDRLGKEITRAKKRFGLIPEAEVIGCYEAGRDGFSVHRELERMGVVNLVVDSASIEVDRRFRRIKTDRLDVKKLLGMLVRYCWGEEEVWSVVRVPDEQDEDDRRLHRERERLIKERGAHGNRIRSLLVTQGIMIGRVEELSDEMVDKIRRVDGTELLEGMKGQLKRELSRLALVQAQIRELENEQKRRARKQDGEKMKKICALMGLRGIGLQSAWILVMEFFGWRDFKNGKEVGAAAGLTGTPYASGDIHRDQGISKAGNRYIRAVMIELAWLWLYNQPGSKLSCWYRERFAGGNRRVRKIGIVALARKLLVALWRLVEHGITPEGAMAN
jgi:transposase